MADNDTYGHPGGYAVGPSLPPGEPPFKPGWEWDPQTDDGHRHEWETVLVVTRPRHFEECVRCAICHCPRCGHSGVKDPCMRRRHHERWHLYLSGRTEMVGGYGR